MSVLDQLLVMANAGITRMWVTDHVFERACGDLFMKYGRLTCIGPFGPDSVLMIKRLCVGRRSQRVIA